MGADDRTSNVAKAFGQHARPNDRISSPVLARR